MRKCAVYGDFPRQDICTLTAINLMPKYLVIVCLNTLADLHQKSQKQSAGKISMKHVAESTHNSRCVRLRENYLRN
jgi:hypothetical protein